VPTSVVDGVQVSYMRSLLRTRASESTQAWLPALLLGFGDRLRRRPYARCLNTRPAITANPAPTIAIHRP